MEVSRKIRDFFSRSDNSQGFKLLLTRVKSLQLGELPRNISADVLEALLTRLSGTPQPKPAELETILAIAKYHKANSVGVGHIAQKIIDKIG